ncbi:hypothetical protein BHM03_00058208 [Ensete ventricosum]|nr:hypothetical protein BHM03_00058208 [Ensete ventricosum]
MRQTAVRRWQRRSWSSLGRSRPARKGSSPIFGNGWATPRANSGVRGPEYARWRPSCWIWLGPRRLFGRTYRRGDQGVQGVTRIRDGPRSDGEGISGVRVSTGSDPTPGSTSGVEIKLDPFITLPKDANVAMADEQPFDDSLSLPEE